MTGRRGQQVNHPRNVEVVHQVVHVQIRSRKDPARHEAKKGRPLCKMINRSSDNQGVDEREQVQIVDQAIVVNVPLNHDFVVR